MFTLALADLTASDWIGIYGAILASVLAVLEIRKHFVRVKVTCGGAMAKVGAEIHPLVCIEVMKVGERPVVIEELGFLFSNNSKYFQLFHPFTEVPWKAVELEEAKKIQMMFMSTELKVQVVEAQSKGIRLAWAYARDSHGKFHKAKVSDALIEEIIKRG